MPNRLPVFDKIGDEGVSLQVALDSNEEKIKKLQAFEPTILDVSVREPNAYSSWGHRVSDKIDVFRLVRGFGFKDIMLGEFKPWDTVDEQFCKELTDQEKEGCFAFSPIAPVKNGAVDFDNPDSKRMIKAAALAPNVLFEFPIWKADETVAEQTLERFDLSVQWIREAWKKRGIERSERNGRVYINIFDTFEAFYRNTDIYARVIKYLGAHTEIDGVLFEDELGTSFHFQVGNLTRFIRSMVPPPKKLLVHLHENSGTMYASALEAALNGADGLWAGFTPIGGMLNNAASSVFLGNLLRIGNEHVTTQFKMKELVPLVRQLDELSQPPVPTDYCHPIIGGGAYLSTLRVFEQNQGDHMSLPPEEVGAKRGFRIVPAIANNYAMSRRMEELGIAYPSEETPGYPGEKQIKGDVFQKIWNLMQESLVAGHKVDCNDEDVIREYLDRARQYFRDQDQNGRTGTQTAATSSTGSAGQVKITEINYHGSVKRSQADEYIEIANSSTASADLSGWRVLSDGMSLDRGQGFVFPDGAVLQPGKSFRVYTNQVHDEWGGYSFGSRSAIWKDRGDIGTLYDANGQEVSRFSYGVKDEDETKTIGSVKEALGLSNLIINIDPKDIEAQTASNTEVKFLDALHLALESFVTDGSMTESPMWMMNENPGDYGLADGSEEDAASEKVRELLNTSGCSVRLFTEPEDPEDEWVGKVMCDDTGDRYGTSSHWIFQLVGSPFTDSNTAAVGKSWNKPTINWGSS